jgi:cyclophilin family peptidyl-prolyl cis-trans isomerase
LIEVANASCTLGRGAAVALLTRLARERDPGVLAALLEGLVEHPELFTALSPALRESLVRAPFDAPEGTMLEARIHATKLARSMGREELVRVASASSVRALRQSADPEAGVRSTTMTNPTMSAQGGVARVRWVTDAGSFELELDREAAPRAVEHLLSMVEQRRYDGLRIHRVVPGFVVQGGDPRGDGYGGTETPIMTELSLRSFERGAVGVPLAGLDTGGMQVFIVLADAPHLDGRYPWIGRVTQGIEAVDGLLPGDRIVRVERSQ